MKTLSNQTDVHRLTFPVVHLDDWFNKEEINEIINICERDALSEAPIRSQDNDEINSSVRKSKASLHYLNNNNAWFFDKLNELIEGINERFFQFDLTGYDFFQYTVYDGEGSHYDTHGDMFYSDNMADDEFLTRKLSLTLHLSDPSDYTGGEFESYHSGDAAVVEQTYGRAIFFPSFVPHRITPLKSGVRKSIVVWVLGPKFK